MRAAVLAIAGIGIVLIAADKPVQLTEVKCRDIGFSVVVVGELGLPIGKEVIVHGKKIRPAGPDTGVQFLVDTVDDHKLQRAAEISIPGIKTWRIEQEATIRGYETGVVRFLHPQDTNIGPHEKLEPRQVLFLKFRAIEILGPANIKLGRIQE